MRQGLAFAELMLLAIAAHAVPVELPAPDGPFAVGMRRFEIADHDRARLLPGYVWYPANASSKSQTRPYLLPDEASVVGPSMAKNFGYGGSDLDRLDEVIAHSVEGLPPARVPAGFPVILFSHGYECYSAQNTALAERLASHGYIVVSIAHPHDPKDSPGADAEFATLRRQLASGESHEERTAALPAYATAFSRDRLGYSFTLWRDDTLFAARLIEEAGFPGPAATVLATGDQTKLAFVGMSFGGAVSAATCKLVSNCRAAINLDGGNFEPALFNASVDRPFLLLMSDWVHLPLPNRPSTADFTLNDYAYEPWSRAGTDPNVIRLRLDGIRHMGFTDLILVLAGPEHEAQFGTIAPRTAVDLIGSTTLAFLNQHLKHASPDALNRIVSRTPALHIHKPDSVRRWATHAP